MLMIKLINCIVYKFTLNFSIVYLVMQNTKTMSNAKNVQPKNTLGSPSNKFKHNVSPKNYPTSFNKSPISPTPKTYCKTQKSIKTTIEHSQQPRVDPSVSSSNQSENSSQAANINKSEMVNQRSKLRSPKNIVQGSKMSMRSKVHIQNQQKSAASGKCQKCSGQEAEFQQKVKEYQQTISNLTSSLNISNDENRRLRQQNRDLQEKANKFTGVLAENRKLIRQKAMKFNTEGGEIKQLNDRILQLEGTIQDLLLSKEKYQKQNRENFTLVSNGNQFNQFPNMLEVQSEVICNMSQNQKLNNIDQLMAVLGAKYQEKIMTKKPGECLQLQTNESDIYRMLESKAINDEQQSDIYNEMIESKKIEYEGQRTKLQKGATNMKKKDLTFQDQIREKNMKINDLQIKLQEIIQQQKQYGQKCKHLQADLKAINQENQGLKRQLSTFKKDKNTKQHFNSQPTSMSFQQQYLFEIKNKSIKNVNNKRSVLANKLDRIKRISQKQNQIIMQIKQSSNIDYLSDMGTVVDKQ